ncbi:glycosyltransferase family 4 protein [Desulfonatronovibrio hydrogenovorans]|uniref:glycosyltransferase family 4 protein n=1 Tax=Desulfonatronovibrio hydrogenovorans TaxID=53245 RepID=UPI00068E4653|nr:MraY family glycosyltransferase [Desulfonatronovibrio hydrogenovorans]
MIDQVQSLPGAVALTVVFFSSLCLTLVLSPVSVRVARKMNAIDRPCSRRVHRGCVPRLGGLAMAAAFFPILVFFFRWDSHGAAFICGAGLVFLAGVMDDRSGISPRSKFLLQVAAVSVFMLLSGKTVTNLGDILGTGSIATGWFSPALTIVAMTGVINAFNLSDGLDGLAAGLAGIACIFFIPFAYAQENWNYLVILVALLGTILGFLRFNTHPARLFMGDSGSLLLGFVMACTAVVLTQGQGASAIYDYGPVTALIILSLPVADTLYVMFRRILQGRSPVRPDREHLHHRLLKMGLSHQLTVSSIYALMFGMGILAWFVRPWPEWSQFYLVLGIYGFLYLVLYLVEKLSVNQNRKLTLILRLAPASRIGRKVMGWTSRNSRLLYLIFWSVLFGLCLAAPGLALELKYYIVFTILFGLLFFSWRGNTAKAGINHAVLFFLTYTLILVLNLAFGPGTWFTPAMSVLSGAALVLVGARVMFTRRLRVLWPGSLEILLLGMALTAPIILHYTVYVDQEFRRLMQLAFFQTFPLFLLNRAYLRRNSHFYKKFMVFLVAALVVLMF